MSRALPGASPHASASPGVSKEDEFRRAAIPLFLILTVISMGFGLIIPTLPIWARELGVSPFMMGLVAACHSLNQAIFSPIWGRYSDRIGRKPMMILGIAGLCLSFVAIGMATSYVALLVARAVGSIVSSASMPTARALIADLTGPDRRGQAMSFMGAAMGTGFALGPIIGGVLVTYGLWVPFAVGAFLAALTLLLTIIFVRDPLQAEAKLAQSERTASMIQNVKTAIGSRAAPYYWLSFGQMFGHTTLLTVLVFLLVDHFDAQPLMGIVLIVMGGTDALAQGFLTGPIASRLGSVRTLLIGLYLAVVGQLLIGLSPWLAGVLACVLLIAIGVALVQPMIFTLLSITSPMPQGVTMGLQSTFRQAGMMLGPFWSGWAYSIHPALPFLTAAIILGALTMNVRRITGGREPV